MSSGEYPREFDLGMSGSKSFSNPHEFEGYMNSERKAWIEKISNSALDEYVSPSFQRTLHEQNSENMGTLLQNNALFSQDSIYWKKANSKIDQKGHRDYFIGFLSAFTENYSKMPFFNWESVRISQHYINGCWDAKELFKNLDSKLTNKNNDTKSKEVENLYKKSKQIQETLDHANSFVNSSEENFKKTISSSTKDYNNKLLELELKTKNQITNLEKSLVESEIIRISSTYWEGKEKKHKLNLLVSRVICLFYAGFSILAIMFGAVEMPKILSGRQDYFLIFIGVSLISIILWVGRILTRTLLSEQHLANDASERKVFIQTYLALIKEGSASQEERILMLSGIFKNISDGIVRDDSSPDLGVAALASKFMSPTR